MSRAAVYDALVNDQRLIDLGFHGNTSTDPDVNNATILANYDGDQRPTDIMFLVLSWGPEARELVGDDATIVRTSRPLDIWVHMYREWSTDFVRIDNVIKILDDIMASLIQVNGADGYTLTMAEFVTASRDLRDDTYQTLCRSVSYKILSR